MQRLRPYETLARIYDGYWGLFAGAYVEFFEKYFRGAAFPSRVLDLGCGTGVLLERIAGKLTYGVGIDISDEMLAVASRKCVKYPHLAFFRGDFRSFKCASTFDLVTCCFDSINYVSTVAEMKAVLKCAARHLADNGLFIFDFVNERYFLHRSGSVGHFEVNGIAYDSCFHYDSERKIGRSYFRFQCGEEEHVQMPFEPDLVRENVQEAGLVIRGEYGDFDMSGLSESKGRFLFVVKRPAAHDA